MAFSEQTVSRCHLRDISNKINRVSLTNTINNFESGDFFPTFFGGMPEAKSHPKLFFHGMVI